MKVEKINLLLREQKKHKALQHFYLLFKVLTTPANVDV